MSMNHAYKACPKWVRSAVARLDSPVMSRLIKEQNKNNNNKTNKRLTATTVNETSVSCAPGTLPFLGRIGLTFTFCTIAETSWTLLAPSPPLSWSFFFSPSLCTSLTVSIFRYLSFKCCKCMLHDIRRTLSLVAFNVARSLCNPNPFNTWGTEGEWEREKNAAAGWSCSWTYCIEWLVESTTSCFNYIDLTGEMRVRVGNA